MRVRAAQDFQVQQIRETVIVVIGRGASDVAENVLTRCRLADLDQVVVAFVSENVFAEFQHSVVLQARRRLSLLATSITAWMIGS